MKKAKFLLTFIISICLAMFVSSAIEGATGNTAAALVTFAALAISPFILGAAYRDNYAMMAFNTPMKVQKHMVQQQTAQASRGYNFGRPGTATPQEKIISVARHLGIDGADKMQATTRTIYDALPMDGRTVFSFFQGCNARTFPNTNLSENKLQVGEFMIVQYMSLQVMTLAVGIITVITPLDTVSTGYYASDFRLNVANTTVLKPLSIGQMFAPFNKSSDFATQSAYEFLSMITIPPLQEFVATLTTTDTTVHAGQFLKLTFEGLGSIFSGDTTY